MATQALSGSGGTSDPLDMLFHLAREHVPVRIEVEKSLLHFTSVLKVHGQDGVIIGKPPGLPDVFATGDHVRLSWAGAQGQYEMRLEVSIPNINLANGAMALVCKPPEEAAVPRRLHDRHNLSRYVNIAIHVRGARYRVMDLSATGCRIVADAGFTKAFPIGKPIAEAELAVDGKANIPLVSLVAHSRHGNIVGCEFKVQEDPHSQKRFLDVLTAVENKEAIRQSAG